MPTGLPLIVEDEAELAASLARVLLRVGLPKDVARTCAEAAAYVREVGYDLVVLDRRLPDGDGLDLIARLRAGRPGLPILVLTALDDVAQRIARLDAGSDDYLGKLFDQGEFETRVRALLRKPGLVADAPIEVGVVALPALPDGAGRGRAPGAGGPRA